MNPPTQARIEADPTVPAIRISREFSATPAQLLRPHTDLRDRLLATDPLPVRAQAQQAAREIMAQEKSESVVVG